MSDDKPKPSDRDFFTPLSTDGEYRYNPNRAMPPRIFAAPRFHALVSCTEVVPEKSREGFENCLEKLGRLFPIVDSGFMEAGHIIKGGFWIRTIWAHDPHVSDVVVVTGPGDVGFLGLIMDYQKTGDESLLATLFPIPLPYLN